MPVALRDARQAERSASVGQDTGCTLVSRKRGLLAGLAAALLGMSAGAPQVVATFGNTRTISMHHIHTDETITITYKKDGKYDPEALKKLNWFLRDWRENKSTEMDPRTIDLLWEMHTELGSKVPIDIICGYRSEKTNEMLRRTVGGQAKQSQHITGKAIDAVFPDVPLKQMRYSALIREVGGVGYYPTSGTPFVHVDTGPVRAWPRLPRYELALLFPNGETKHKPDDGDSITKDDVRRAQERHKDAATEVAAFFDLHNHPKPAGRDRRRLIAAGRGAGAAARKAPRCSRRRDCSDCPRRAAADQRPAAAALATPACRGGRPTLGYRPRRAQRACHARLAQIDRRSSGAPACSRSRRARPARDRVRQCHARAAPDRQRRCRAAAKDAVRVASLEAAPKPASVPMPPVTAAAGVERRLGPRARVRRRPPGRSLLPAVPDCAVADGISFRRRCRAREARAPRHRAHARAARRSPCRSAAAPAAGRADGGGGGGRSSSAAKPSMLHRSAQAVARARAPESLASHAVKTTER